LVFRTSADTIIRQKQTIREKIDAVDLLIFLIKTYPSTLERNSEIISELLNNKKAIEAGSSMLSNLNEVNLRFCALLLYSCLGENIGVEIIEMLAYIDDDRLSQIEASQILLSFLETNDKALEAQLEAIILQQSIKWCNCPNMEVRLNAVGILFQLLRSYQYKEIPEIVCNQLVKLVDSDNAFIKNTILRKVYILKTIDIATYKYIIQKATLDSNYVVRKVAREIEP
jgi:hypothetical protein